MPLKTSSDSQVYSLLPSSIQKLYMNPLIRSQEVWGLNRRLLAQFPVNEKIWQPWCSLCCGWSVPGIMWTIFNYFFSLDQIPYHYLHPWKDPCSKNQIPPDSRATNMGHFIIGRDPTLIKDPLPPYPGQNAWDYGAWRGHPLLRSSRYMPCMVAAKVSLVWSILGLLH